MTRLPQGEKSRILTALALAAIFSAASYPSLAQQDDVSIKTLAPLAETQGKPSSQPQEQENINQAPQAEPGQKPKVATPLPNENQSEPDPISTAHGESQDGDGSKNTLTYTPDPGQAPGNSQGKDDDKAEPIAQSQDDNQAIAQHLPATTVTGSLQIHKRFKLFTREELIHNLSFRDASIKEVIGELARRGGLNIIIDKSVLGKITGDLHDVTLNEAMESVLSSAGLQSRNLGGNTVLIATTSAMTELGLNRPMAKAFRVSYISPFEVAQLLDASVFNKGILPNITDTLSHTLTDQAQNSSNKTNIDMIKTILNGAGEGGAAKNSTNTDKTQITAVGNNNDQMTGTSTLNMRSDTTRTIRGSTRVNTQEGTGFNSASTDPGSMQVRSYQEINFDYPVDQNGGGAVVIPDARNHQVIVVGTPDDISVAEEAIHLLDKRPKEIHIQASLIEIENEGIRQLGANLALQGEGASSTILGPTSAPLVQYLPGLGSTGNVIGPAGSTYNSTATQNITSPPPAQTFSATNTLNYQSINQTTQPTDVTPGTPGTAFSGLVGALLPAIPTSLVGVTPSNLAQSAFNFLTLSKKAGGRANIATLPSALNFTLNLLLQTNKAKLIANPSVVVSDGTESLITIATEVVHKVTATISLGVVSSNVELVKAGIFLDVLPRATEDGFITMRLRPTVSEPSGPLLEFNNQQTIVQPLSYRDVIAQQVRVHDGQTLVIGGLFTEQEAATIAKVPYAAEVPLVGALFRNTLKARNRTELMLLLTPKIVEEEPGAEVSESAPPAQM